MEGVEGMEKVGEVCGKEETRHDWDEKSRENKDDRTGGGIF
jgi:hypothetical protein